MCAVRDADPNEDFARVPDRSSPSSEWLTPDGQCVPTFGEADSFAMVEQSRHCERRADFRHCDLQSKRLASVDQFRRGIHNMIHRHDSAAAALARALVIEIFRLANGGPVTSVLICDDRPVAAEGLAELLEPLPSLVDSACVQDAFALVDAYSAKAVDLVLIGVHAGSRLGHEAIGLMLGINPAAVIIVVGAVADADALAAVFVRGARGLVVWEPDELSDPDSYPDGPLVW